MEKFLDTFMNKVKVEGKTEAYHEITINMIKNGIPVDTISASIPDLPKDEIQEIFDSIMKDKE
ncbi:hypothetical protein [Butyrivibrio sp. INlla21]|uniref:hypothetical protein n=1 Tax=Butyrivibrio sp. INlla21 TaxID=1520811 RepID=UPI0008E6106B|nr:hypothetical protein [Butyrivibrio sp. INlla21]SFU86152.1 hypothetical protein SAMN02910342_02094 [Butyrivibrio sp. INlla21]